MGNNSFTRLREVISAGKKYADILFQDDIPIVCVNKNTGKSRSMSFKVLYSNNSLFWIQNNVWEYYLADEELTALKSKVEILDREARAWEAGMTLLSTESENHEASEQSDTQKQTLDPGFGAEFDAIAAMTDAERIQQLQKDKKELDNLLSKKAKEDTVTQALVDTTRDAALVNHVTLLNAMYLADDEAKKHTQSMVDSTNDLIKSSSQLISPNIFNDELMNILVEKSNGTIIQHMTRVFLNGMAFLTYYNDFVSTSSIINKFRATFEKKYKNFYYSLLPHLGPGAINMERAFMGGMRAIPQDVFFNWATGFLVHDIGKASAVEYHEGEAAYDRDIVTEHIKIGYNSIRDKTNYPREAALITGYHHEYYGDPTGYGCFRVYLDHCKKVNPYIRQNYCISYELEPMIDCEALAYFPAKVLEIVDVYDSITDPNRKYRKALTPEEALTMMQVEFTEKHHKLDVILFDIFANFVREKKR